MKQLLFALALTCAAVTGFADTFNRPAWNCKDADLIKVAVAAAPNVYEKGYCQILLQIVTAPPATYADFTKIVDNVCKNLTFESESRRTAAAIKWKKQFPLGRNEFIAEAWAFKQNNSSDADIYFYTGQQAKLNLTDTQVYKGILEQLLKYNYSATATRGFLEKLVRVAVTANVTTQKTDFQQLNRKYSIKLLSDKTAWEPVVVCIRTTLETY